jgi:two-component system sensor kinase FixL
MLHRLPASARSSFLMPVWAAVLTAAIFAIDTLTTLDIAVAVLYVAVVLMSMEFAGRRGVAFVAVGCAALTLLSFAITHGEEAGSGPVLRCFVALTAIAITATLAVRNQNSTTTLREQASLLDQTHDTIFVRNNDDVISYWNRAATELYGWDRDQAIGRRARELLQTEFPTPVPEIMTELMRTGRWDGELVHTRRDGTRRTVASRWALQRDERGRAMAVLETNNDITERRRAEDGLHRAQAELAHVSRVATLGELTASIAHEINQPLAAVVTNGEACLRWLGREIPDLAEAKSSVERMIYNGRRASEVVARLRALSRKADPLYAPLDIADVVDDAVLLVRRELQAHQVALSVAAPEPLPQVRGDRVQLQQVIINLLMNGIQAMDGVTDRPRGLSIYAARSVDPEDATDRVVVTVGDNGPGIPDENHGRLFEAFFTTKPDGMGMGLSICRSIIEAHGGRIWATNRDGAGACFHFSVPVLQEPNA